MKSNPAVDPVRFALWTLRDKAQLAEQKGLLKPGVKAGEIVAWLKEDFGLGHGHAMAIYATFKGKAE